MSPTPFEELQRTKEANNNTESSVVNKTSSASSFTPTPPTRSVRNDDSNPQQGTGGTTNAQTTSAIVEIPSEASSSADQPVMTLDNSNTTISNTICDVRSPAGSCEVTRRALVVPPFKKDSRKLFVGGLPQDGMFRSRGGHQNRLSVCLRLLTMRCQLLMRSFAGFLNSTERWLTVLSCSTTKRRGLVASAL